MIGDVLEGLFSFIIELLFRIIVEILLFYTGEIVLWVLTCGWKQIRWNFYADDGVTRLVLFMDLSALVGGVFWFIMFMVWYTW